MTPSAYALFGIEFLLDEIKEIQNEVNGKLQILGYLICNFDRRTRVQKDVAEKIKNKFNGKVFDAEIGVNIHIEEAQGKNMTIYEFDSRKSGAKDYDNLAKEVIDNV